MKPATVRTRRRRMRGAARSNVLPWVVGSIVMVVGVVFLLVVFGPDTSSRPDTEEPSAPTAEVGEQPPSKTATAPHPKPQKVASKQPTEPTKPSPRKTLAGTYECTPLHMAALEGNADKVRSLLAQGADMNATTKTGSTPLWYAVATGRKEIAQLLRDKGALPVGRSSGYVLISIKGAIGTKDLPPNKKDSEATFWYAVGPNRDATAEWFELELRNAARIGPAVVVLEIDTPGGLINHAERMAKAIISHKELRFLAFVRKAVSAGVPIALACKEIYFADGAIMGAAASFLPDSRGLPMKLPEDYEEKMRSVWRAVCRSAAEHGGHSPLISEAMIDLDFTLTMRQDGGRRILERNGRGKVIKRKGRLLTLTAREAVDSGLGKALVGKVSELGRHLNMPRWEELAEGTWERPMHRAAAEGDMPLVLALCRKGKNVNEQDSRSNTPLHLAARSGKGEIVKLLLARGADVNASDKYGWTPLHRAAGAGHAEIAKALLDKGANVNAEDEDGDTPLHWAARYGKTGLARILLRRAADAKALDKKYRTPARVGEIVKLVLARGADVNASDKYGWTPLHRAAGGGPAEIAKLLLDAGANVNARMEDGWTPLHEAALGGDAEVVKLLIDRGANVNAKDKDACTPLHSAALARDAEVVKLLLDKGANVNAEDEDGDTPLHWAARYGKTGLARILLRRGADAKALDKKYRTPARVADDNGHRELAELLRAHRKPRSVRDDAKDLLGD